MQRDPAAGVEDDRPAAVVAGLLGVPHRRMACEQPLAIGLKPVL
jgi:hypothetical protein